MRLATTIQTVLGQARNTLPRHSPRTSERGSASIEAVIAVPALLLLLYALVEGGLYAHTRNMAARAAQAGAISAAAWHSTDADGAARAQDLLNQTLHDPSTTISVTRTNTQVVVTVNAASPTLIGLLTNTTVSQSAAAPIERWTP